MLRIFVKEMYTHTSPEGKTVYMRGMHKVPPAHARAAIAAGAAEIYRWNEHPTHHVMEKE